MKVLMLGWEYPPHISGGLGTACEGLTLALSNLDIDLTFVVPRLAGDEVSDHMTLIQPFDSSTWFQGEKGFFLEGRKGTIRQVFVSSLLSPYLDQETFSLLKQVQGASGKDRVALNTTLGGSEDLSLKEQLYSRNIFNEVNVYAQRILEYFESYPCNLIHMHDWMTFLAGVALAKREQKPLIAHVHSLECDRSGVNVDTRIADIERHGLENADLIIAVSNYTKKSIMREYGISEEKIVVVHNGIVLSEPKEREEPVHYDKKNTVLFMGRVTYQKGPEYFVRAAAKVLQVIPDAEFVLAGSGDMVEGMKNLVAELGISSRFSFPGFLQGSQVEEAYSSAAVYVMPSVSEPFGLVALEAANYQTPVIVSHQSGVSEVLHNALKTDFWDVDRLADLIANSLLYEKLRSEISLKAKEEIQLLQWREAAEKVRNIYMKYQ
jgi:glycogen synthase